MVLGIEEVRRLGPFQKSYQYNVRLPEVAGAPVSGLEISKLVESVGGLPLPDGGTLQAETTHEGGRNIFFATTIETAPVSITFVKQQNTQLEQYLAAWKGLAVFPDGTRGYPADYKIDFRVELLDQQGNSYASYLLVGAFPLGSTGPALAYTSSEILRVTQNFSVDDIRLL